ncbi:MAG TPA: DNA-3-methyladenine glycosylase [Candidatus Acidoferrales bacterium]|nr:DNA-3-methyladenine glycosylase [Candidatus Acidoferrales bacterium]
MRRGTPAITQLGRSFFERPTLIVAPELIGCALLVDDGSADRVVARIVEVEAYLGMDDPASHAYRGPTPRSAIMFDEPGHLYVYLSYGMHQCANVVTESIGTAGAVLLRGAVVEEGEDVVRRRRGASAKQSALLRGPGNLCRGLGISLIDNAADLCATGARIAVIPRRAAPPITAAPRVGISVAADRVHRFAWTGSDAVSSPRPWSPMRVEPRHEEGPAEPVPRLYVPFVDGGPGRKFPGLMLSRHSMPLDGLRPDRDATRPGLNPPLDRAGAAARRYSLGDHLRLKTYS